MAKKHGGQTSPENLAYACFYCNTFKGPSVAGVDPQDGEIVRLFNPRADDWGQHFRWEATLLLGLTAIGRVTIQVLRINQGEALAARRLFVAEGTNLD